MIPFAETLGTRVGQRLLVLFLLCALLPVLLAGALSYGKIRDVLINERVLHLGQAAEGYGTTLLERLLLADQLVRSLAASPERARQTRLGSMTTFTAEKTVLFVHGATVPSGIAFDLSLGGESWMDYIAKAGYDVWFVDVRVLRPTRPARRPWISRRSRTRRSQPPSRPRLGAASLTSCRRAASPRLNLIALVVRAR